MATKYKIYDKDGRYWKNLNLTPSEVKDYKKMGIKSVKIRKKHHKHLYVGSGWQIPNVSFP